MVRKVVKRLGRDNVEVRCGSMAEGVKLARESAGRGASLIVSRGGTAAAIERELNVPVIAIETSSYDVIQSIGKAGGISKNIGIVGFDDLISSYNKIVSIIERTFSVHVAISRITPETDLLQLLRQMSEGGAEVFIGGHTVEVAAERLGFPFVSIETIEETVEDTVLRAESFLVLRQKEKERIEILNSIIDFAYDGILAIDKDSVITVFNPVIQKITNLSADQALGRPVDDVVENSRMSHVMRTGIAELGELQTVNNINIVTNRVPIVVDGEVMGVVATFQDVEKFQSMEASVRKKLRAKGHVAKFRFADIIGQSSAITNAIGTAQLYARVNSTVLLFGESGTGKELFAQSIHNSSERRDKPFVAINCAALPESLLESELFGYVEGAFTGARKGGSAGLFEMAHTGTIFLDEISEMQPSLQAHLLRVIQEKEVTRIGADNVIPVDVRIIAATNRDLYAMVEKGLFREDLYYRLCVLALNIPPLRERKEDIPDIVRYHMARKGWETRMNARSITDEAMELLIKQDWPGNVRQLENLVERCVVLSRGGAITPELVRQAMVRPASVARKEEPAAPAPKDEGGMLHNLEEETILRVLAECGGNRTHAARKLGISSSTLWRRLKKMGFYR
jgi:PAS domain S-box-containing protein